MIEFGRLTEVLNNIKELDENQLLKRVYGQDEIQDEIIDLNTFDQLYEKGIDSEGQSLGEYANITKVIKSRKGQRFDHVTLKDTGEFYDSWTITPLDDGFLIDANPIKETTNLFEVWGVDVLGLTPESLGILTPSICAELTEITLDEILR